MLKNSTKNKRKSKNSYFDHGARKHTAKKTRSIRTIPVQMDNSIFTTTINIDKRAKSRIPMAKKKVPNSRRANPE
jgi:hypothetical protein